MSLDIITSDALRGIPHGFFGRRGGASSGVYKGLNCGPGSSDQAEIVAINRARVAEAMNVSTERLATVHQVHSADAVQATARFDTQPKADAIVTATPGLALGILTADCQPVLFADPDAGVIGAAHAGWRGALEGVLEATVEQMEGLGASRDAIVAVIGPTISQGSYEVGPEFLDTFLDEDPDNHRFFANGVGEKYLFDLPAYGLHRLRRAGVGHAEWTRHCTYSDSNRFFSFRHATHSGASDYGRMMSAIRL